MGGSGSVANIIKEKIRENNLFEKVRLGGEAAAISVLADILGCEKEVPVSTPHGKMRVDLLCYGTPIEVEFYKAPYEGFQQAIAYIVLAGFPRSIVIHILPFYDKYFVEAFCKIVDFLRKTGVDGLIIVSDKGETIVC